MISLYWNEAVKNIRSNIILAVSIVLIIAFLIMVLGLAFAWGNLYVLKNDSGDNSLKPEAFLEYAIYVLNSKPDIPTERPVIGATYTYNPDDPDNPVENELSDEEKAHNEAVFASYRKLSSALENIDGLNVVNKLWGSRISDDSSAYPLSLQAQGRRQYNYADAPDFYINLGYTMEEIERFCDYYAVKYDINTILLENFTCCKGRIWTEKDLDFEYLVKDGCLPTIPVLMGYDFIDYYDVGDVLKNPEGKYTVQMIDEGYAAPGYADQSFADYVVIGFLSEDTVVERTNGMRESLNSYIVVPHVPRNSYYFPNASIASMANDFYMELSRIQFYIETDKEESAVRELSEALSEDTVMGVYLYPEKQSRVMAVYTQINEKRFSNYLFIALSTLVFTVFVIILIIINKLKKNTRDAVIHRLVGATVYDNVAATVVEFIIYLVCSDIISTFVYVISVITRNPVLRSGFMMYADIGNFRLYLMLPLILLTNLFILAVVVIVSGIFFSKTDISQALKEKV